MSIAEIGRWGWRPGLLGEGSSEPSCAGVSGSGKAISNLLELPDREQESATAMA